MMFDLLTYKVGSSIYPDEKEKRTLDIAAMTAKALHEFGVTPLFDTGYDDINDRFFNGVYIPVKFPVAGVDCWNLIQFRAKHPHYSGAGHFDSIKVAQYNLNGEYPIRLRSPYKVGAYFRNKLKSRMFSEKSVSLNSGDNIAVVNELLNEVTTSVYKMGIPYGDKPAVLWVSRVLKIDRDSKRPSWAYRWAIRCTRSSYGEPIPWIRAEPYYSNPLAAMARVFEEDNSAATLFELFKQINSIFWILPKSNTFEDLSWLSPSQEGISNRYPVEIIDDI